MVRRGKRSTNPRGADDFREPFAHGKRCDIARAMPITYSQAGVDIDRGDALVERIKKLAKPTRIPEVVTDIGGFAGLCALPKGLVDPILVSGTDGVGTKLDVAFATGVHDTVGIDLVAMCVNDVITCGARPLFFLDYFATGKLELDVGEAVVRGIAEGCKQAGCALLGGETAEMPGMYEPGKYDLAGFVVGVGQLQRKDRLVVDLHIHGPAIAPVKTQTAVRGAVAQADGGSHSLSGHDLGRFDLEVHQGLGRHARDAQVQGQRQDKRRNALHESSFRVMGQRDVISPPPARRRTSRPH